ncbi:hypothetical protein GCM10027051_21920 [Niabella terrae]
MTAIDFTTVLKKYGSNGDKTGWTYLEIPAELAVQLHSQDKKAFRVKGRIDNFAFTGTSLIPAGQGNYIMAVNGSMRKGISKKAGATVRIRMEADQTAYQLHPEFLACLKDDPEADAFFHTLSRSHQHYYSKWIDSAKTIPTRDKRIAMAITGLARKMDYGTMIRFHKNNSA